MQAYEVDWTREASSRDRIVLIVILSVHAVLLAFSASVHSPVFNEVGHLPAGISHWQLGRFDLYRVNPPLVRLVAALPVLFAEPKTDWKRYSLDPLVRSEPAVADDFLKANDRRSLWLYVIGRWACIPFSLLGGYICFRWAADIYGIAPGFVAACLWCFCPNILGNAALIMPDVPAAALGLAASYRFSRWLGHADWRQSINLGLVLGLAELTKATLLVFYPLWPTLWMLCRLPDRKHICCRDWAREGFMLAVSLTIGICIVNLGYGFEGSNTSLSGYSFASQTLTGLETPADTPPRVGNRFSDTWLAALPVPLPKNYIQGLDTQKSDFECGMPSYLNGVWANHGWWYFYLYALAIKVPLGTLAIAVLAIFSTGLRRGRINAIRDEVLIVVPGLVILALVSSQTGFSVHFRYILPAVPFAYVWCSRAAKGFQLNNPASWALAMALAFSVSSSLWIYPHSLSYFNALVGGPKSGHAHLVKSSTAWGQDLHFLREWCNAHPQAQPLHLAALSHLNPRLAGIEFVLPPFGPRSSAIKAPTEIASSLGPLPGWYAIDVNFLHGPGNTISPDSQILEVGDDYNFSYFERFEPVARAGWSIYVYQITTGQANRVRAELKLPPLAGSKPL